MIIFFGYMVLTIFIPMNEHVRTTKGYIYMSKKKLKKLLKKTAKEAVEKTLKLLRSDR